MGSEMCIRDSASHLEETLVMNLSDSLLDVLDHLSMVDSVFSVIKDLVENYFTITQQQIVS